LGQISIFSAIKSAFPPFGLEPHIRFDYESGKRGRCFFRDPSGNPIEVKGVADWDAEFAT